MTTVRVPRRIIYQLDLQIEAQRKRVAAAQAHLVQLEASRSQMEPMDTEHGNSGRASGGHARADSLSPDRRSEIASKAANKRWRNDRKPVSASQRESE